MREAPLVDSAAARSARRWTGRRLPRLDLAFAVAPVFAVEAEAAFMAVADRAVARTVADTGKFRRRLKGINGRQIKLPAVFFGDAVHAAMARLGGHKFGHNPPQAIPQQTDEVQLTQWKQREKWWTWPGSNRRPPACKAPDSSPPTLSITLTTNVSNNSGNLLSLKS